MENDLHIFRNGISGYAPQGSTGSSGSDGYSVHYSSFDSSEQSIDDMLLLISQKKVLSTNPNYGVGVKINYKLGDAIITIDSTMFIIEGNSIEDCHLTNIGLLKIISNTSGEGTDIFGNADLVYNFTNNHTATNDYNYINRGASPLYHHRDTNDDTCNGNYIQISDNSLLYSKLANNDENNPIIDGHFCTLVLNFSSGLRLEKILTTSNCNDPIFIDNRYLYPFGNSDDNTKWSIGSSITTYDSEKSETISNGLRNNIKTENSMCMCSGYITYHIANSEYRKQIIIR